MVRCFNEVVHENSDIGSVKKLGEGTYGEAYRAGTTVCKVVPFDGDLIVNGETQKVYFINWCSSVCIFLVLTMWCCFVEVRRNT